MDFITEEIVKQHNFTPEQIEAIKPLYENDLANKLKERDNLANSNAEKIIQGAIDTTLTKFGITDFPRQAGEKNAEYLARLNEKVVETSKTNIAKLETELKEKIKNSDGSTLAKEEVEKLKSELDEAKKKLANYDELEEKASKYESTAEALSGLKLTVAYQSVKPNFPDTVNPYEAKAIWGEFEKATNEKYIIELVENEPYYIDRENEHKRGKLKDLVDKDANITQLMQGRKQEGTGGRQIDVTKVDGVPFDVPKELDSEGRSKLIREYLTNQKGLSVTSAEYTKLFGELNTKIKNANK